MIRRIEWTREAYKDFDRIEAFYAEFAPDYAVKIATRAFALTRHLGLHPNIGAIFDHEAGIRKWQVKASPFLLFYRVMPEAVQILRIRHMAEDWKPSAE